MRTIQKNKLDSEKASQQLTISKLLLKKFTEYKIPLIIDLIDYNKAFDSIGIPEVIDAPKEQGVEPI